MLHRAVMAPSERSRIAPVAALRLRSTSVRFSSSAADPGSASAPALRLYRSLLRAQRKFPVDEKRAVAGRDMRTLVHSRIRSAFEQSRDATGAQAGKLLQTGEEELHALRTIGTNHFATEVSRSRLLLGTLLSRCTHTSVLRTVPFADGQPRSYPRGR